MNVHNPAWSIGEPRPDMCLTGWQYADTHRTYMKRGFADNVWDSDHRGHCLDATDRVPGGSTNRAIAPGYGTMQYNVRREG